MAWVGGSGRRSIAENRNAKAQDLKLDTLVGDRERGKGKLTVITPYAADGTVPMTDVGQEAGS